MAFCAPFEGKLSQRQGNCSVALFRFLTAGEAEDYTNIDAETCVAVGGENMFVKLQAKNNALNCLT